MFRFQHSVVTMASPELAWEVFSNMRRWNSFANIYGRLEWREGAPWQPGSRLEIEILRPARTIIEHVITSCVPGKRLGWIDHALGVALAQWVTFETHKSGGTRVHTWGDLVHSGVSIGGCSAEQLVASFTETWYENFRRTCDDLAVDKPGSESPSEWYSDIL
jgi:hypothetical protein